MAEDHRHRQARALHTRGGGIVALLFLLLLFLRLCVTYYLGPSQTAQYAMVSSSTTTMAQDDALPKIYYLFMIHDHIYQEDVWAEYLEKPRASGRAQVLVHASSNQTTLRHGMFRESLVPTVPSQHCSDLVTPMNHLISSALARGSSGVVKTNSSDVFVFVSGDAIPVKPFEQAYSLHISEGTMFCLTPSWQWGSCNGGTAFAVKTHQWVVLSRADAEKAVAVSAQQPGGHALNLLEGPSCRLNGCVDEYWHLLALRGYYTTGIEGIEGIPYDGVHPQGKCATFVWWDDYPEGISFRGVDVTGASFNGRLNFSKVRYKTLMDLRDSPRFLFARKFRETEAMVAMGGDDGVGVGGDGDGVGGNGVGGDGVGDGGSQQELVTVHEALRKLGVLS